jgi:hypothetical protein
MGGDSRAALGVLGITGDTTGALDKTLPSVVANTDSVVPASTATLNSAFDAVRQLLRPLPSALPMPTTVPGLP